MLTVSYISQSCFFFQKTNYKVSDRYVEFQIEKMTKKEQWPRLTYSNKKPAWLKIDFDHFAFEEDSAQSTDEDTYSVRQ